MTMPKIASFKYKSGYTGWHQVEVILNDDGSLTVQPIGYYEDAVVIPVTALQDLGLGLVTKPDKDV